MHFIGLVMLSSVIFSACEQPLTFEEQQEIDLEIIETYVADNNLVGEYTQEGVFYSITKAGVGTEKPNPSSTIDIIYTGYFLDGSVFDSSNGFPVRFQLFGLIQGWQIGLQQFNKESAGILLIPSRLAYGRNGSGSIPPNTVIRFDIELLDFQ